MEYSVLSLGPAQLVGTPLLLRLCSPEKQQVEREANQRMPGIVRRELRYLKMNRKDVRPGGVFGIEDEGGGGVDDHENVVHVVEEKAEGTAKELLEGSAERRLTSSRISATLRIKEKV